MDRVPAEDSRRGLETCATLPRHRLRHPLSIPRVAARWKRSWKRKVSSLEQSANPLIAFLREIIVAIERSN